MKYCIGLKHFFNINLGIGIIKKTIFFVCIFDISFLCFYSNFDRESSLDAELNSASNEYPLGILLTDPTTQKTRIPEKTWWCIMFFQVFLVSGVAGSIKSIHHGYYFDAESNYASNNLSWSKFEQKHREICWKYEQKK